MTIQNEFLVTSKRFFGKHFVPGIAGGYEGDAKTIYINQDTAKKMNTTFAGKPVYVEHVHKIDPSKKDGVVVRAFYNEKDGQHWVEFMVETTEGLDAIENKKWKLSNAYDATQRGAGGEWNGIRYDAEIVDAKYNHLAIVEQPRYEESIILTPEEFEEYNNSKEVDLKRFLNSKRKEGESMFNLFKKTKVENSKDYESLSVTLPKSGKEFTLVELITNADEKEVKEKEMQGKARMANADDMVDTYGGQMNVGDLVKSWNTYKAKEDGLLDFGDQTSEDRATNADKDEDDKKKENEGDSEDHKKYAEKFEPDSGAKNSKKKEINPQGIEFYNQLKNAAQKAEPQASRIIKITSDKVALGKELFGSKQQ